MAVKKKKMSIVSTLTPYKKYLIPGLVVLFAVIFFSVVMAMVGGVNARLSDIIRNLAKTRDDIDVINQSLLLSIAHTNEMRTHLGLSVKTYPINEKTDPEEADEAEGRENLAFFKAIETMFSSYADETYTRKFDSIAEDERLIDIVNRYGFQTEKVEPYTLRLMKNKTEWFSLQYMPEGDTLTISTLSGDYLEGVSPGKDAAVKIEGLIPRVDLYNSKLNVALGQLKNIESVTAVGQALRNKELTVALSSEDTDKYSYNVNKGSKNFGNIGLYKKGCLFFINDHIYDSFELFYEDFLSYVVDLDTRDERARRFSDALETLQNIFTDKAFLTLLESKGLHIVQTSRKDEYFTYYDVVDKSGAHIGSFAVDMMHFEIYIMDSDDIQIGSIKSLMERGGEETKKKISLPETIPQIEGLYHSEDTLNLLLCGSNVNNTDTIMILHIDRKEKKITIVSVPRDLYYKGRRINTVYWAWGPNQLLRELEEITGLKIEKFMHIDMFAFIDVVDILGGIDIYLYHDLIDPTYKIKENGKWETLCYKKGTYHLNGVQTLRVARSRHYSTDFDRSRRQQTIIMAIRDRLKEMSIFNLDKIYQIISTLLKYVRTNITPLEMAYYFNTFKDYRINAQNTLDTTNVLYATYSNIYLLGSDFDESRLDENFNKGAWILLPINNDFNLVKWYVRELITNGKIKPETMEEKRVAME
ncbi:MAG: LCP family protein [Spirochaetales bacterium]|nr:LCP family protein [Spirochaetales bacterium]